MNTKLETIKSRCETIASNWDGETSSGEERAQCANEIIEKIDAGATEDELKDLIEELDN